MREIFKLIPKTVQFEGKTILDAGSGDQSLEFLTSRNIGTIYSVSIDAKEVEKNKSKYGSHKNIVFVQSDLTKESLDNKFDLIFCDYFFAGVEGFSPFKSLETLKNLKASLKADGVVVIVGLEPLVDPKTPEQTAIEELIRRRGALKMWLGEPVYRELPRLYLESLLNSLDFKIEAVTTRDSYYDSVFFTKYLGSIESHANNIDNLEIKKGLLVFVDEYRKKIKDFIFPCVFGEEYVLIGRPNKNSNHDQN